MAWLKRLLMVITALVGFALAALAVNQEQVALTFIDWQTPFTLSIFWWMLMALVSGIILGWSYNLLRTIPLRIRLRQQRSEVARLESEILRLKEDADKAGP
ncbi:MAG TPA: hypothetical protein DCP57_10975 [Gammaproteobacteria bacterium]|jgi:uncharacterized membrane protein YciS (DUF1049 family)|nr:hypothetical protein [Gammaproteobacteria bacterium]HBK19188.1 hypothetical protein [Gammaproteobacteria bacterium]